MTTKTIATDTTSKFHKLTPVDGEIVLAVKEFFKVPKGDRGNNTLKGDNGDLSKTIYIIKVSNNLDWYISLHILPVTKDSLFADFVYLKRGHCVVKAVLVENGKAVLQRFWDAGSLDKFANLDQDAKAYPKATTEYLNNCDCPVTLEIKYSGSHIIWVTLPEFIEGRTETERISNPFTTFFMSKNGYNNDYSRAGEQAVRKYFKCDAIPRPDVANGNEVTIVSFELMKIDEHVYLDDKGEDLYVIQVATKAQNDSDYVILDRNSVGLPVVEVVGAFTNARAAIEFYDRMNKSENNEHGCEGFILVVKNSAETFRVKLKFGDYLMRRQFRWGVAGSGAVSPRCETLMENVKQWGYSISIDRQRWWADRLEQWWWWLRSTYCPTETFLDVSSRNKYIRHRDEFLNNWETIPNTRELIADIITNKKMSVVCVLMLVGVSGSGKDYLCDKYLASRFPGWLRSQDQCGSDRTTYGADFGRFVNGLPSGLHWAIANRGNWGPRDRGTLAWEFGKVANGSLIKIINVAIDWRNKSNNRDNDVDRHFFNLCMKRICERPSHPNLTFDALGAIGVGDVVRQQMNCMTIPDDAIQVDANADANADLIYDKVAKRVPTELAHFYKHSLSPLQPETPIKKSVKTDKYKGIACFDGHITLQFGSSAIDVATESLLNVSEGTGIEYKEIGSYCENGKIAGLLVDVGDGLVRHITTWTAPNVKPVYSNELIGRLFGCGIDDKPSVTNHIVDDCIVWYDTAIPRLGFIGSMKM